MPKKSKQSKRNIVLLKVYADLVRLNPDNEKYIKQYAELLIYMGKKATGIKVLCHLHDLLCENKHNDKAEALARQFPLMGRIRKSDHWQQGVQDLLPSFARNRLWLKLHQKRLCEGEHLFCRGDHLDTLYLVCEGELAEFLEADDGTPVLLGLIRPGDVVAENKLLNAGLHQVDVVANKPSVIVKLPRKKMLNALLKTPDLQQVLARKVENRHLIRLISSCALLQAVPFDMRQHLAEESYIQVHASKKMIYKAGEKLDHVALIVEGEAHYQLHNQAGVTRLETLKPGVLIGETAAIHNIGCPADLVTEAGVRMVYMSYDAFINMVEAYPPLRKELAASAEMQRTQLMRKLDELQTQQF